VRRLSPNKPRIYTSRLQKGGALLDDMRMLVQEWQNGDAQAKRHRGVAENVLGKRTRFRVDDTYMRAFIPRFAAGDPPDAWKLVRPLEEHGLPLSVLRPIYYWVTARSEALLYDFVTCELFQRRTNGVLDISIAEAVQWVGKVSTSHGLAWSSEVTLRVARGP